MNRIDDPIGNVRYQYRHKQLILWWALQEPSLRPPDYNSEVLSVSSSLTYTASRLPVLDQAIPPISPIDDFIYLFFLDCYEVLITKDLVGRVPGTKRHQPVREQSEYRVAPQNIIKILQK